MATDDLNVADLETLAATLNAIDGVSKASTDPSEVRTPGVWIRFDTIDTGTLSDLCLKVTLFAVVGSSNTRARDLKNLQDLFNLIKPALAELGGPSGPVNARAALVLPGSQALLPAFEIPLDLYTTN